MSSSGIDGLGFFRSRVQPADDRRPFLEIQLRNSLLSTIKDPFKREYLRKTLNLEGEVSYTSYPLLEKICLRQVRKGVNS